MTNSSSLKLAVYVYLIGLVLTYFLFPWSQSKNNSAVLGRSYPLTLPDISAGQGDTLSVEGVSAIVQSGTFDSDVYLRVDRIARGVPKTVSGLWQVSDIYNTRFRFHSNDDEVPASAAKKDFIFSFPYSDSTLVSEQGVYFREDILRLARGDSAEGPWTIIENSVDDPINNTVSALTRQGGYFMIVGGNDQSSDDRVRKTEVGGSEKSEKSDDRIQRTEVGEPDISETLAPIKSRLKEEVTMSGEKVEEVTFIQSLQDLYKAVIAVPDALLRSLGLL